MTENIYSIIKRMEDNYTRGTVKSGKYVDWNMYETIETIRAYLNSKHISGPKDALGRDKPFFNIVNAIANIWFKATDIDRKNISIKATKKANYIKSFIASILLKEWMRKTNFGKWLNSWGLVLSRYGSAVSKFVEKEGKLYPMVIPWERIICDPIDFNGNPVIEKLFFTPAQLKKKKGYDTKKVDEAIKCYQQNREDLEGQQKETSNAGYIGIYEIHGDLPLSLLTGKENDNNTYVQQMHVVFINGGKGDDVTLYSGKEEKSPYRIDHLIEEEGRALSIGPVEASFDPQWMANHSMKLMKDQLDLASKMILQTTDSNFENKNMLSSIETGDILVSSPNSTLSQVNNQSHDIPSLTSFMQQWQANVKDITSTPDALRGTTMPSGTPYSQTALLNQEARTLFELMIENKGLALEEIIREFVIPSFKRSLKNTDEVLAVLEGEDLKDYDNLALPAELAEEIKNRILKGELIDDTESIKQELLSGRAMYKNARSLRTRITWEEYFKDLEWDVMVEVSGEEIDKQATLTTLANVMQTVANNPNILQDPNARMLFNKILEQSGVVSPSEIVPAPVAQMPQSVAQVGGQQIPTNING